MIAQNFQLDLRFIKKSEKYSLAQRHKALEFHGYVFDRFDLQYDRGDIIIAAAFIGYIHKLPAG